MNKIAITLHDNDFHSVCHATLRFIRDATINGHLDIEDINVEMIKIIMHTVYMTHQNHGKYQKLAYFNKVEFHTDEQVDKYLEDFERHNSEYFVWDINHDYIYSV